MQIGTVNKVDMEVVNPKIEHINASRHNIESKSISNANYILSLVSILFLGCHLFFSFANPDMYMGIADYYIFLFLYIIVGGIASIINKRRVDEFFKYALFVLAWFVVPTIIAVSSGKLSTGYFLSDIVYFGVLLVALNSICSNKSIKMIINFYVVSGALFGLLILIQKYDYYGGGGTRYTFKFLNNEAFDPNFLGAFLLFPALLSLAKLLKRFNLVHIVLIMANCGGMFLTSSRAAMLSFIIGGLFITFHYFKKADKHKRLIILLVVAVCIIFGFIVLPQNIIERLFSNNYFDGSNKKRLLNWFTGLDAFLKRPLFGYGFRSELEIIQDIFGIQRIAHNTYIAFLLQFGIVGCIILLYGLIMIVYSIRKNMILLGLLFSNLFVCIFISAEAATFFWLPLILIIVIAKNEKRGVKQNAWL